jgi:acyl-coenzyme A thioesterase PaaI-like protein
MWLAVLSRLGVEDRSVTVEITTAFLSAAREEDFTCTARVLKWGRRLIYGAAECVADDGRVLAHHTLWYSRTGTLAPR